MATEQEPKSDARRMLEGMLMLGLMHERQMAREKKARLDICDALLKLSEKAGWLFDELSADRVPEDGIQQLNETIHALDAAVEAYGRF